MGCDFFFSNFAVLFTTIYAFLSTVLLQGSFLPIADIMIGSLDASVSQRMHLSPAGHRFPFMFLPKFRGIGIRQILNTDPIMWK